MIGLSEEQRQWCLNNTGLTSVLPKHITDQFITLDDALRAEQAKRELAEERLEEIWALRGVEDDSENLWLSYKTVHNIAAMGKDRREGERREKQRRMHQVPGSPGGRYGPIQRYDGGYSTFTRRAGKDRRKAMKEGAVEKDQREGERRVWRINSSGWPDRRKPWWRYPSEGGREENERREVYKERRHRDNANDRRIAVNVDITEAIQEIAGDEGVEETLAALREESKEKEAEKANWVKDAMSHWEEVEAMDQDPEPKSPQPEPDHEAARRLAGKWSVDERIAGGGLYNLSRAYLARADELAALKEKVKKVPHFFFSATGRISFRESPCPGEMTRLQCVENGGACLFTENPDG